MMDLLSFPKLLLSVTDHPSIATNRGKVFNGSSFKDMASACSAASPVSAQLMNTVLSTFQEAFHETHRSEPGAHR